MYDYLSGKLVYKGPTHVVLDVGGIGYHIVISLNTYEQIKADEHCKLYISFQVREDSHTLYGFYEEGERRLFLHLLSVSGIGANTARMILSSITPTEIQNAIIQGNVDLIQRIKGIGPKSAQRMILELQDKLRKEGPDTLINVPRNQTVLDEALSALVMLGFVKIKAEKVLQSIYMADNTINVENLIKQALKKL
ncbi:Holliday junction branch migration protein RuvA [Albibacterium sp.]|uniref:Holliday junction branch migration protein RuvA n=1 Tax=Albibacterium sp. TaxID=2952885 RepID=UPI002CB4F713|nr:Holliday junction branch migration protein RuvA [Albibacterium sp.]HUH18066.1 Holliday junction branch migration protein RuvA [Albibacterium sp.]